MVAVGGAGDASARGPSVGCVWDDRHADRDKKMMLKSTILKLRRYLYLITNPI